MVFNDPKIFDATFKAYEHGTINLLDCIEVNAKQYEVKLQNNDFEPEWFYVNLYENTICTINIDTRERGPLVNIYQD